jgi:hypothetical protein
VLLLKELVKETNFPRGNTETKCDMTSQDNVYISIRDYISLIFYRILHLSIIFKFEELTFRLTYTKIIAQLDFYT